MLFPRSLWPGLADGTVTVAFRRWSRPTVKAGGTLQSPGGLLAIDEVAAIEPDGITDDDARAAGSPGADAVVAGLRGAGTLYRVRFHRLGEDPRIALRQRARLDGNELDDLRRAIGRLDWALPVLRLIAAHPGVVSTKLANALKLERLVFKQRVRRLKALGLTESLTVGYRLSPRGAALLARISDENARRA
jgi:hypothetical protein